MHTHAHSHNDLHTHIIIIYSQTHTHAHAHRHTHEGGSHHFRQPTLAVHQQLIGRLIASNNRRMHISTHIHTYMRTSTCTVHPLLSDSHINFYPNSQLSDQTP